MNIATVFLGLLATGLAHGQEPSFVGTWNLVVKVETSSCMKLKGTEIPYQWNIARAGDGTYFVGKKEVTETIISSPYTGTVEDGVLTLTGGKAEVIYSRHLVSLPSVFELRKKGEGLTGRFIGSLKVDAKDTEGVKIHPICAITGRITSR